MDDAEVTVPSSEVTTEDNQASPDDDHMDEADVEEGDSSGRSQSTIVMHPGSLHLRIGRASDSLPITLPHCIAWKSRNSNFSNVVPWLSRQETEHAESIKMVLTAAQEAQKQLGELHRSNGKFRQSTSADQLAEVNEELEGEETDTTSQIQWTDTSEESPEYIIGDDALYLEPDSGYHIIWPISFGEFNTKSETGYTVANIMQSLEILWTTAMEKHLDIAKDDIPDYNCILLIPDLFNRTHIRHMMEIVLERIGFNSIYLLQESVCATLGVGLGSACVVDIGDQKTSISCVEDGMSLEPTRLTLRYGGRDITRTFSWLLDHISFPYIDCQHDSNILDALLLQELKHSYCHMDTDAVGTEEVSFQVRPPCKNITKYSMHVGDERIIPTLAVFWPNMFGLKGDNLLLSGADKDSDHTDIFDLDYIERTRSKQEESARLAAQKKREMAQSQQLDSSQLSSQQDLDGGDDSQLRDDDDMEDETSSQQQSKTTADSQSNSKKSVTSKLRSDELLALDEAILWSIEQCDNDEMRRRMYSSILLVGGGLMFEGVESLLQYRVWLNLPQPYRQSANVNVVSRSKDIDVQCICWKGAAILCVLDMVGEQWITLQEWTKHRSKIVRQKVPFVW